MFDNNFTSTRMFEERGLYPLFYIPRQFSICKKYNFTHMLPKKNQFIQLYLDRYFIRCISVLVY